MLCDAMKLIMTLDIIKAKIRIANIGQISKALQIMLRAVFRVLRLSSSILVLKATRVGKPPKAVTSKADSFELTPIADTLFNLLSLPRMILLFRLTGLESHALSYCP